MKKIRYIEGFSESAWKSLVVKSLRIGWVEGLQKASEVLCKSTVNQLLIGGLFEDLFPGSMKELNQEVDEILRKDYESLCSHETHHGRGYTDQFCDMEEEAVENGPKEGNKIFFGKVRTYSKITWLNPRVYNCLYTWDKINPQDEGVKREPLHLSFAGMPDCILDGHTVEGNWMKQKVTFLSGHYFNHREIGKRVMREGWEGLRKMLMNEKIILDKSPTQKILF
jgi:hypothetical protein